MAEAVIFDVDGTLVDSNDLHAASWQETFLHFGKPVPLSALRQHIGKGADQYMPVFWSQAELNQFGKQMADFREKLFGEKYLLRTKPFPEAKELLARIRGDDKLIALASSSKSEVINFYIDLLGIEEFLDIRTGADEAQKSKPEPDIFAVALEHLGVSAENAIVVGDTPYDAEAAGKLGLRTIGVLCGGFSERELKEAGAVAVYQGPADLLGHYESSPITQSACLFNARNAVGE